MSKRDHIQHKLIRKLFDEVTGVTAPGCKNRDESTTFFAQFLMSTKLSTKKQMQLLEFILDVYQYGKEDQAMSGEFEFCIRPVDDK